MNSIRNLARLLGIDMVVLVKAAVWRFANQSREEQQKGIAEYYRSEWSMGKKEIDKR